MLIILKILLLGSIFSISTALGVLKAKGYYNRVWELKNIKNSLEILKSKIEFTYEPIGEVFAEISQMVYSNQQNIFGETIQEMRQKGVTESWNNAVKANLYLTEEDKTTIQMFGKLLGKTDKAGQINEINVTSQLLDTQIEKAEKEKEKNYKLFKTLGSLIGIGLCIILI